MLPKKISYPRKNTQKRMPPKKVPHPNLLKKSKKKVMLRKKKKAILRKRINRFPYPILAINALEKSRISEFYP